jgi:phenylacetate-CoA ligase
MNLLKLYQLSPYPIKSLAATLQGLYLSFWRYNYNTEQLIEECLEREHWSVGQWSLWKEEHVSYLLHHARKRVPYYRNYWDSLQQQRNKTSWEILENWPLLQKETIRQNPYAFIAEDFNPAKMFHEHTSGTTGKPLSLWVSKSAVLQWYALFEARWRGWYGLTRHDRWGILGGQLVIPFSQRHPPFWVWNASMNQLYFSSYHLAPQNASDYIRAIQNHELIYLLGYASSLYSLAQIALEQNLSIPVLKAVISNAEPLYIHQREVISRAFQCPVYDTYGLSEKVCAAGECLQGSLHIWPEVGLTEVLCDRDNTPLPAFLTWPCH